VAAAEVAAALRAGRTVTTSRPSPEVFASTYAELARQGARAVVSVHLSAKISGTCAAAEQAAAAAPVPVTVLDCGTLAMAAGFAVLTAAAAAQIGRPVEEVARLARDRAAASTTYFYVDTLEFLRRGGRIRPTAALLGTALSVKPLLTVSDGEIRPLERVRTESRALARLEELGLSALARAAGQSEHVDVAVHHLDNSEGAARLVGRLRDRVTGCEIAVTELSAVIGVHVGPGMLGLVISPRI
ncbi:MAG TPA: DegV family protein, partial [Actinomycetota bacterium]|nr:DegV family protein [Actinomycetota bacterium]